MSRDDLGKNFSSAHGSQVIQAFVKTLAGLTSKDLLYYFEHQLSLGGV